MSKKERVILFLFCASSLGLLYVAYDANRHNKKVYQMRTLDSASRICRELKGVLKTQTSDVVYYKCVKGDVQLFNGVL